MKKMTAGLALAAFLVAIGPKKSEAQVLEGALIGAAVGGVVGLFLHFMKPGAENELEPSEVESAPPMATRTAPLPGTEIVEDSGEPVVE